MKAKHFGLGFVICVASTAYAQQASETPQYAVHTLGAVCAAPCLTFVGTVKREVNYGPPGFGETPKKDRRIVDYILVLDKKINIDASKYVDPAKGVGEIQLFISYDKNPLTKKIGRVEVRGTLEEASTAAAIRDYTLTVYSLRFLQ